MLLWLLVRLSSITSVKFNSKRGVVHIVRLLVRLSSITSVFCSLSLDGGVVHVVVVVSEIVIYH